MNGIRRTHDSPEERITRGREARGRAQRSSHSEIGEQRAPTDAVALVEQQNATRLQFLVPVRRGRMSASAFTFFRGAARVMAADLVDTPVCGLEVQLGGDAHLSNFGAYGSPERRLVFDANDFDETLRGPFEWDVKRLAASFAIAARHNGMGAKGQRRVARISVRAYRQAMAEFAAMGVLALNYDSADLDDLERRRKASSGKAAAGRVARFSRKAKSKDSTQALRKLTVEKGGRYHIRSTPPVLFSLTDLQGQPEVPPLESALEAVFAGYRDSLPDHRRALLGRFTPIDAGLKVVGVGSVGTRCLILLMEGRDRQDPFFLQFKEAGESVLEEFLPPSPYAHSGQRVVEGQRLVQSASDPFLGWTTAPAGTDFYVRQLKDWKGTVPVDGVDPAHLRHYAELCGFTLARGHARTGDPIALSSYLGKGDGFDRAVAAFAGRYTDRNEEYSAAFAAEIFDGQLDAVTGV